jgi:hypothetical protein
MQTCCKYGFGFVALTLLLIGCDRGPTRIPIKGTVTYKEKPVTEGTITFVPKDATKGTQEGSLIVDGQYAIAAEHGLMAGEYHVSIRAPAEPSVKAVADAPPGGPRRTKDLLPEDYNKNSKLSIEVTAAGKRVFDFKLD